VRALRIAFARELNSAAQPPAKGRRVWQADQREDRMKGRTPYVIAVLAGFLLTPLAAQGTGSASDHVAAVKQSLQSSMAALRQYQWVETPVVSVKGEEKSRTQNSCYYGADGKVQRTPMGEPPADSGGRKKRGLRGKIVESKKEDMTESMQEAIGLVKQYLPPDPTKIEAAKQAGKLSVSPPDAKGNVQLVIKDYLKAGDSLAIDLNAATNSLAGMSVSTFTDSAKDAVGLNVTLGALADGTIYTEAIHLDVEAQHLAVAIENSGYRKLGG